MHPDIIIRKHGLTRADITATGAGKRKLWVTECRMEIVVRSSMRLCILEREWKIEHSSAIDLKRRYQRRKHLRRYRHWIVIENVIADFMFEKKCHRDALVGVLDRRFPVLVEWRRELVQRLLKFGFAMSEVARALQVSVDLVKHYK